MRNISARGWEATRLALRLPDTISDEVALWAWARREGSGNLLVVTFILGVLDPERDGFPGLREALVAATPVRLAFALDKPRRDLMAAILRNPHAYAEG